MLILLSMEFLTQSLISHFPTSTGDYAAQIAFGFFGALFVGSFTEHTIHRWVMHQGLSLPTFLNKRRLFPSVFHSHAVLHHGTFYKEFDHEDDPLGREENIIFTWKETLIFELVLFPFVFILALFAPVAAAAFFIVPLLHNKLWNLVHHQMHQPKERIWAKWPPYLFLARYHLLHHRHTETNFNVVLPFADYVLRTNAQATSEDVEEMHRLGYL